MKKIKTIIAVLTAALVMGAFAGCTASTSSPDSGSGDNGGSGSGGSGDSGGSDSSETIGTAWGSLFSNTNHNSIDLQIWQNFTTDLSDTDVGMKCTISDNTTWFGGAIVQSSSAKVASSVYYDMSSVAKITFKVRASATATIWAGASSVNSSDTLQKDNISLTTEWQDITINLTGVSKAWAIFAFGGDAPTKDLWIEFKDVTYLDSSNNSLALLYSTN